MRLHPRHWSLATKWSLLVTLLALGPLLSVIGYSYESATERILQKSIQTLTAGATDAAANIDAMLDERVRQARFLSNTAAIREFMQANIAVREGKRSSLEAELAMVMQAYPYLEAVDLLGPDGSVVFTTSGQKLTYSNADLVRVVRTGQIYMGGLQPQPGQSDASLVIGAPVGEGAALGVVRLQSSPRALMVRVTGEEGGRRTGTLSALLDESGRVISRSDKAGASEALSFDRPTNTLATQDGHTYYAQGARIQSLPWTYVLALPVEAVAAELSTQRLQSIVLAFGASLVIGGLSRLLVLRLIRPLVALASASKALSQGDLTFEVARTGSRDEVGQLQESFGEAYKQLRRLVARMRLSSHLVAEASSHLHSMTRGSDVAAGTVGQATEKLSVVAQDLERQVAHFRI